MSPSPNHPGQLLSSVLSAVMLLVGGCDSRGHGQRENLETGQKDISVVPEMLIGAQYRGGTGGHTYDDMTWIFDRTHFRIVAGQAGLPADLTEALLPVDLTGYRIDGTWSVEGEVLTVTDLSVDGKSVDQPPRTLRAMCTPVIRIQADKRQYMFRSGTIESAWKPGDIPIWPPGTTSVSGSVPFESNEEGWISVGYHGMLGESESISDSATLNWEPDDSGRGAAQTTTHAPRFCRLQLNGGQPATMQCMALPPGVYLFYAKWKTPDPRELEGKIVVGFTRWRLQGRFTAKWVIVDQRPATGLEFDLVAGTFGNIAVHVPPSDSRQSVFLLPWGQPDTKPPPLGADQAWQMARWAGNQLAIEAGVCMFEGIPAGRHRLFLVEHEDPVDDDDIMTEYKVIANKSVMLQKDAVTEVSF